LKQDDEPFNPADYLQLYYDAFSELTTCITGDGSRIPFTSIVEYFKLYKIEGDFDNFLHVIRRMEGVYLEFKEKKQEAKNEKLSKKNNNPVRGRK